MAPRDEPEDVPVQIDELNLSIIKHLRDGRRSFGDIARELGVTENTVRARVRKLVDGGVLVVEGHVNPFLLPDHFLVLVGVKLKTMKLVQKAEEFKGLRGVVSVVVVTGEYDLILTVLLNSDFNIKRFYTEEVSKLEDVRSCETWVVYHNVNMRVPYVL